MVTTTPLEAIRLLVSNRHTIPRKTRVNASSRKECEKGKLPDLCTNAELPFTEVATINMCLQDEVTPFGDIPKGPVKI